MLCNSKLGVVNVSVSVFAEAPRPPLLWISFNNFWNKKMKTWCLGKHTDGKKALAWCPGNTLDSWKSFCNFHVMNSIWTEKALVLGRTQKDSPNRPHFPWSAGTGMSQKAIFISAGHQYMLFLETTFSMEITAVCGGPEQAPWRMWAWVPGLAQPLWSVWPVGWLVICPAASSLKSGRQGRWDGFQVPWGPWDFKAPLYKEGTCYCSSGAFHAWVGTADSWLEGQFYV